MISLIDLQAQFCSIQPEIEKEVQHVLKSGNYIMGPQVRMLEKQIAARLEVQEAVSVANGTEALTLTLEAFHIGVGDEVITTPFTFIASAEAISRVGATPVFADVDPATGLIDPQQIKSKLTMKTKAIIPVHLFGQAADMDAIMEIARQYGLVVIEDACQAFGATYNQKPVGALGDAGCFSFFPTKNLGGLGDGGMIVTNNKEIASHLRRLRVHGSDQKYYHEEIGYNSRLDTIQAAILLVCLKHIDQWNNRRRELAKVYLQAFQSIPDLSPIVERETNKHIYHLYCLNSPNRDHYVEHLKNNKIAAAIYYPVCLHQQKAYQFLGYQKGDYPHAEGLTETIFAIPMHPFLTADNQQKIIEVLKEVHPQ